MGTSARQDSSSSTGRDKRSRARRSVNRSCHGSGAEQTPRRLRRRIDTHPATCAKAKNQTPASHNGVSQGTWSHNRKMTGGRRLGRIMECGRWLALSARRRAAALQIDATLTCPCQSRQSQ